jgi:hypothetical protein
VVLAERRAGDRHPFLSRTPRLIRLERKQMLESRRAPLPRVHAVACATRRDTQSITRSTCAAGGAGSRCSARPPSRIPTRTARIRRASAT